MDNRGRADRPQSIGLPPTAIASEATFAGCLAVIHVARQLLLPHLPPSVELPQKDSITYPCLLAFGEQTDGSTFFGGFPLRLGIRYHELMVAIPFVRWDRAQGEHLFITGMICDFAPALWIGNVYYGFSKRLAQIRGDGERFSVADESRQSGFCAVLRPARHAAEGTLEQIRTAAALSVLGHRSDGVFVRSRFDWDFREAAVEAASLALTIGDHFRELPLGAHTACHDAYRIRRMRWRLSWPTTTSR
jgi:hypothetical protein